MASSLPPYSTYQTDTKQLAFPQATSYGNILTFTPPGFRQSLSVKYPDSRLPVCYKCKKNFKTRGMCRVRNAHTEAPWNTAYVCVTMDASCTDERGNFVDKPLTLRMVQWQPYAVRHNFAAKTPVCSLCKRTNRTRSFCRGRHHHRHLPWCTVYVLLSALDSADPDTVVAGASQPAETSSSPSDTRRRSSLSTAAGGTTPHASVTMPGKEDSAAGTPPTDTSHSTLSPPEDDKNTPESTNTSTLQLPPEEDDKVIQTEPPGEGDDIHNVAPSRTFLALVSSRGTSIHWLDLMEHEEGITVPPMNFVQTTMEPASSRTEAPYAATDGYGGPPHASPQLYAPHLTGFAQQQEALKSQQQYFFHMHHQHELQQQATPHPSLAHGYHHPPTWQQLPPTPQPPSHEAETRTAGEAAAARLRAEASRVPPPHAAALWPSVYAHAAYPPTPLYHHAYGGIAPSLAMPHPAYLPAPGQSLAAATTTTHHLLDHSALPPDEGVDHGHGAVAMHDYSPNVARALPTGHEEGDGADEPHEDTPHHHHDNERFHHSDRLDDEERDAKRHRTA